MSLLERTTPSLKKRFREEGEEGRRLEPLMLDTELFWLLSKLVDWLWAFKIKD